MDKKTFSKLLEQPESNSLDWKRDFPPELIQGRKGLEWKEGKGTLLKDLVSMANGGEEETGVLVYGVKDHLTHREIVGISRSWDDSTFQEWVERAFDPSIQFSYSELEGSPQKTVGIFEIHRSPNYPHVASESIGGMIHKGQVWFRRGTKNTVALYKELNDMFHGLEPLKISRLNSPTLKTIEKHYKERGRRTTLPRLEDKDDWVGQGYEVAYAPNSRREVWAGYHGGQYEHILMLKPNGK